MVDIERGSDGCEDSNAFAYVTRTDPFFSGMAAQRRRVFDGIGHLRRTEVCGRRIRAASGRRVGIGKALVKNAGVTSMTLLGPTSPSLPEYAVSGKSGCRSRADPIAGGTGPRLP